VAIIFVEKVYRFQVFGKIKILFPFFYKQFLTTYSSIRLFCQLPRQERNYNTPSAFGRHPLKEGNFDTDTTHRKPFCCVCIPS